MQCGGGDEQLAKETVKEKRTKNNLPLRLNILFIAVFLAFSVLIARLGYVQLVEGDYYSNLVHSNETQTARLESARGKIVDVNGEVLADNDAEPAVVYIRHLGIDGYKNLDIARKLARLITMDPQIWEKKVTPRDKKEYYVLTHYKTLKEAIDDYLSKKEQNALEDDKEYSVLIDRIPDEKLGDYSKEDEQIISILHEFNQASNLSPHIIKKGLSNEELARVGESLDEFYGTIRTDVASNRVYPTKNDKNDLFYIGKLGDIPAEKIDSYLAKGYSMNDLVGTSNLEQQYENYLRGIPTTLTFATKNGVPVGDPTIKDGRRGYDLQLTVDTRLQEQMNQILEKNIRDAVSQGNGQIEGAYAVAMNPNTGAVLALGGKKYQNGKMTDNGNGAINFQFRMGSAVKGATLLTGFRYDAVPSSFTDRPIIYPGGAGGKSGMFSSWSDYGLGTLTPERALEKSSNVFMAKIASNMAGISLTPSGGKYVARGNVGPKFRSAFLNLRDGYRQFGLGTDTGIDLPNVATGYLGDIPPQYGNIHQFAIGQFDTYTPLQMAQYVSTIANGGHRMQPHLLKSVHAPGEDPNELGPAVYTFEPKVLNTIDNTQKDIERVQKGMYLVTHGSAGTARTLGSGENAKYKISGKTGTAELDDNNVNETFISYAPYDDPEIAVAVVVPNVDGGRQNQLIARDIIKAYDDLYHFTDQKK